MLHPPAWNLSPWSGAGDRSVPGPAESWGSRGAAAQNSHAGWNPVVAPLGWAHSERHTPTLPFQRQAAPGVPKLKDQPFLLAGLGRKLFPLSPVPQASRLAFGRHCWSKRLPGVPSPALCPAPSSPLQAAPHFSLRHPWAPVELYPALGRLLEISSADIWTPCLPFAMRAGHLKADSQARGTGEWFLWGRGDAASPSKSSVSGG